MGEKRSRGDCLNLDIYGGLLVVFAWISMAGVSRAYTNPSDVAAINSLYAALGSPPLPGWLASAGDPCAEAWQGVTCNVSVITSIVLNGANLGGGLGENLGMFSSIKVIDLSNNHIGGSIPSNLPSTMQNFFLSANQFTGIIPISLSYLTQLTDMSLNNNFLFGEIPNSFVGLAGLINLDFSSNNLSGQLPPSLSSLSSLTTLHMQNNLLSGTLDVLQDLPLKDLNIENNHFSGPIPEKLLSIPNFINGGNQFNSTITPFPSPISSPSMAPPSPPAPPAPPLSGAQPSGSGRKSPKQADRPSVPAESNSGTKKFLTSKRVVWISISGVLLFIILALGLLLLMPRFCRGRQATDRFSKRHEIDGHKGSRRNLLDKGSLVQPANEIDKVPKEVVVRAKEAQKTETRKLDAVPMPQNKQDVTIQRMGTTPRHDDHEIDMSSLDMICIPPPPPPPPPPPLPEEKVIVKPLVPTEVTAVKLSAKTPTSARSFTIAFLQQYTNSFSQENLIGAGMLGSVYRAQLPDGKLLAVKKLDKVVSSQQKDDEFLELVNNIDIIRHANVVELMGYCAEHGQRLLIYEYCSNGTLQDALHSDDESKKQLSWNIRIRIALGAARALEYLHEVCQPPVVHRNFKSANVLLDDELSVRVSDCGLAPLISSSSVSQLSGHLLSAYGYGAPEYESGIYNYQSDVYSFGVVMLELLTGRKSYDRTRNRGEQFLVRWAIPQLHDIDALSKMVDPSLKGQYPAKSLSHFADIISRCVQTEPEFRPPMSEVVQDLLDMIRREPSNYKHNGD